MRRGAIFPQTEIGTDPGALRHFAQAAEALGFDELLIYDHVLGADPARPGGWSGPYTKDHAFHEVFVTLGYLAGFTRRIELVPAVLVLPQRQTSLVAKQAAQLDLLSEGRLRLGVGVGWNAVEYEALGESFANRGRRQEEQVELLRALWENDIVDFEGRWHRVSRAGIKPRPTRRIPIWFGGSADATLRRAARLGDGWFPILPPNEASAGLIGRLHGYLREQGRDPAEFGIEPFAQLRGGDPDRWRKHAESWSALGASGLALATMNAGLAGVDAHVEALERWQRALEGIARG
jgi:probable F420-dependent oxidoreductase